MGDEKYNSTKRLITFPNMGTLIHRMEINGAFIISYPFFHTNEQANMSLYIDNPESVLVKVYINEENGVVRSCHQFFRDGSLRVFSYDNGCITSILTYTNYHLNGHVFQAALVGEDEN